MEFDSKYDTAYGVWRVSTEADAEGRGIRDLGVYLGYVDEIAFALADQQLYSLRFTKIDTQVPQIKNPQASVNVAFNIDSGTWDWDAEQRAKHFKKILRGRNVNVDECPSYAAVTLKPQSPESLKREAILAKLSPEQRKMVGMEGGKIFGLQLQNDRNANQVV